MGSAPSPPSTLGSGLGLSRAGATTVDLKGKVEGVEEGQRSRCQGVCLQLELLPEWCGFQNANIVHDVLRQVVITGVHGWFPSKLLFICQHLAWNNRNYLVTNCLRLSALSAQSALYVHRVMYWGFEMCIFIAALTFKLICVVK